MAQSNIRQQLKSAERIVLKVGTRVVTDAGRGLDLELLDSLARQVARMQQQDRQALLVTSGAVHEGRRILNVARERDDISFRQAAAAVGQPELMRHYMQAFAAHGVIAAQILMTQDDMRDRHRYVHLNNTLEALLRRHVVPVINENDSVSVDGVTFVENDLLAAMVAAKARADALIFLTDQEGLFTEDPRKCEDAELIDEIGPDDPVMEFAEGPGGPESAGGMVKKCEAARMAATCGIPALMVDGREHNVVLRVLDGEKLGTIFVSRETLPSRKLWIATAAEPSGDVIVDDGARKALEASDGSSLLPVGITEVRGEFEAGDLVRILSEKGEEIGRGLANYSMAETDKIKGHHTSKIPGLLGHVGHTEVVHRDNMVITSDGGSRD